MLDLEDVAVTPALEELAGKIGANDPYVKAVRVGRFKPGVVRLVFDLKTEAKPEVFTLKPIAEYGHRLVLDIYPAQAVDPLLALAGKIGVGAAPPPARHPKRPEAVKADRHRLAVTATVEPAPKTPPPGKPDRQRLIIVAIDAGHGGEDPGAKGRGGAHEKNVTLAIARKLKDMIDREPNMRGVLTRDGDYFIPLHHRVEKARQASTPISSCRCTPTRSSSRTRAARRCSRCRSAAPPQLGRQMARQEGKRRRSDRRRESRRAGPVSQEDARRSLPDRDHQRQPEARAKRC